MMKAKFIIVGALIAISSLLIIPLRNQAAQKPLVPEVHPVSASLQNSKDNTPPTENKAAVEEETSEISAHSTLPAGTDFKPSESADSTEILTETSTQRDNPTPTPVTWKNTVTATAQEPRMGDSGWSKA
jgi:cytoskeletal protein RodZ